MINVARTADAVVDLAQCGFGGVTIAAVSYGDDHVTVTLRGRDAASLVADLGDVSFGDWRQMGPSLTVRTVSGWDRGMKWLAMESKQDGLGEAPAVWSTP